MKATGVVRRIDELGRIVIPKEIRKNYRIKEGENLEIYLEDDNIILKKYSLLKNINELSDIITESIHTILNKNMIITDNSTVISTTPNLKKEYFDKEISEEYQKLIMKREKIVEKISKSIKIIKESQDTAYIVNPIIINGDLIGSICLLSDNITNNDIIIMDIITKILSKYIEE